MSLISGIEPVYLILAGVAAFLLIVLIALLCYLCCCSRPVDGQSVDAPEATMVALGYVPDKLPDATVYLTRDKTTDNERVASPTELVDMGYTPTQLVEQNLVREATKTELLATGYTKSQLHTGLPKDEDKNKKQRPGLKVRALRPLKSVNSNADDDDEQEDKPVRAKGKKRAADRVDDDRQINRKKKSPPPATELHDLFAPTNVPQKVASIPAAQRRTRKPSQEVASKGKRIVIKDSNEQLSPKRANSPSKAKDNGMGISMFNM